VKNVLFDEGQVRRTLSSMLVPGAVFEVRALEAQLKGERRKGTVAGYFDNVEACISRLAELRSFVGVYATLNPVDPALLARCANRFDYSARDGLTKDQHIFFRRHFLIDVDYKRPSGISATDAEKEAAHQTAKKIYAFLKKRGFPEPIIADSGNGYHLLYRIDLPSDDKALLEKLLAALAARFDGGGVELDRTVFNPSRIARLYGTLARKGDDTPDRPHRLSQILIGPKQGQVVSEEQLQNLLLELAPAEPEPKQSKQEGAPQSSWAMEDFLTRHGIEVVERVSMPNGAIMWLLAQCPFNPDHKLSSVAVFQFPDGTLGFDCKHAECVDKHWKDFRRFFEPDYDYGNYASNSKDGKEKFVPRKSAATELVELAEEFEFFHDSQDRPFVRLEKDGHPEIWPVESTKFRKLLARVYYKENKKAVNRNALGDAITTLAGKACHDGGEEPVFLRVAPHDGNILIDLCDKQWRVVEVTPEGWRILERSPVAFIRTGSMQALPLPVQGGGSIAPLWELLNVSEAQRPLVTGSLLNAFDPEGPYFVTNYIGEHGAAKSCAAKIERQLVDPSTNPLRSPPKEERDLISQAASNWVVALDNLSWLPPWLSDALCRFATGGGHSARTLYTDLEEISLAVKRPVFLNGIEDVAVRPDLTDRALQIELEEIPKENRMLEKVLWSQLDRHKTGIFSAILDGLSCALRNRPKIKIKYLPRMADAVIWATAGETSFGFKRGTFLKAYVKNLDESAAASIEIHPVGLAIKKLLEKQDEWSGTPAELLEALGALVSEKQQQKKSWPENAQALGHALRRLAPALRRAGFDYQRPPRADARIIVLSKKCSEGKTTSETSVTEEKPEKATSSDIVGESITSSVAPRQTVDTVDLFPTMHDGAKSAPEPPVGASGKPDTVDL
jgi:hypothetical protein